MIRALRDAATAGDVAALEVLDRVGQKLGVGIANLVNLFNPQMIVIGGWSGTMLGGLMLPRIQQTVQQYALAQPMANTGITLSRLGWDAVSLGAATLALQAFLLGENGTIRQKGRQAAHSE
jgi:predicted NBD/HSP70 family sugar kinase